MYGYAFDIINIPKLLTNIINQINNSKRGYGIMLPGYKVI